MAGPLLLSAVSACSIVMTSTGSLGKMPARMLVLMSNPGSLGGDSMVLLAMTYLSSGQSVSYIQTIPNRNAAVVDRRTHYNPGRTADTPYSE